MGIFCCDLVYWLMFILTTVYHTCNISEMKNKLHMLQRPLLTENAVDAYE